MKELTAKQQAVFDFLRTQKSKSGVTPTSREIQEHFGFSSQTAAMDHLRALERKGAIERLPGKARAIVFPDELQRPEVVEIPIYGNIAAGLATDSEQRSDGCLLLDIETLAIPRNARTFALTVRGDSMIGAHIMEGDFVVLEFKEPRNKDIVAALIDGETTLKRYIVRNRRPFLKAENPDYPDLIPAQELVIQGVMVALLRKEDRR